MNVFSVISEFNPFHNGHKYLINSMREYGATHIAAIMSGNFTQRGEPAILDKYERTRQALNGGVDLVILLPVTHATATAELFAHGGVSIADAIGCCSTLFFGSECGEIEKIEELCDIFESIEFKTWLLGYLTGNITLARARELAVTNMRGKEYAELLRAPNNILAIEYMRAIRNLKSNIKPMTITRLGALHDNAEPVENCASSSFIRSLLESGLEYGKFLPEDSHKITENAIRERKAPVTLESLERVILYRLRTMSENDYRNLPDISEGIENRVKNAVMNVSSLEELFDKIKTKRYTTARLRRLILHALLTLKESDCKILPPYIRVLGFNERGKDILRKMRETAKIPIVMKAQDIKELDFETRRSFECECIADDIYALASPKTSRFGKNYTANIIIDDNKEAGNQK